MLNEAIAIGLVFGILFVGNSIFEKIGLWIKSKW